MDIDMLLFSLFFSSWWLLTLAFLYDSSSCLESQREAALLLGQFAAADSDCKVDETTLLY